jgi:cytochrome c oxidase subunit 3
MAETALTNTRESPARVAGWQGIAADWSSDQRAFKNVSWGKAMMWIFLLSDTFIFSCFLLSYMTARMSTTVPWPNPSEVFALTIGDKQIPLILIAIMTFVLISSSGTMAMAVNFGYRRDRAKTAALMLVTAAFGATFVGMQAFEWTKLITEGVRPWGNPWGAAQFGSCFFMITGFHDFPDRHRAKGLAGRLRCRKARLFHEQEGTLRGRRNHRPLLALRRSCVGIHLCLFLSLVRSAHDKRSGTYRRTTPFATRSYA